MRKKGGYLVNNFFFLSTTFTFPTMLTETNEIHLKHNSISLFSVLNHFVHV